MENLKSKKILQFLILFIGVISIKGQAPKRCNSGFRCILLNTCPALENLLRKDFHRNINFIRANTCGFDSRRSKVCCPIPEPERTTSPGINSFQIGHNNRNLLPRSCGRPTGDDRIKHGTPAPIGAYPWMAAMGYTEPGRSKLQFICSGSIINSRYILTAAHCLDPRETGRRILTAIHLGDYDLSKDDECQETTESFRGDTSIVCNKPHLVVGFEETVSHPMYNKRGRSSDDIALIRLNTVLDLNSNKVSIDAICLPEKNINYKNLAIPVAAGWGLTENNTNSDILLHVKVPFADEKLCRERYNENFVGNQLCVGGTKEGFDTCSGDSGGPLVTTNPFGPPYMQIGIVSFGPFPCGLDRFPGVYTAVADYRDWIINNMKP